MFRRSLAPPACCPHIASTMYLSTETLTMPPLPSPSGVRRRLQAIGRLRERLFELQCEAEPDPAAIDGLMRRLARVRRRCAADPAS